MLVLLFHAGLLGLGGGFIGVDVFYVLSGFLITGLLLRELEATGSVDLIAFYARRARRILPAAAAILVITLLVSALVISPLDMPRVAKDALAVALSAGNIRFALDATDYFATDRAPSPFLHYWSLGVEEQFYLLWPAMLLIAVKVTRRLAVVGVLIALVVIVSYAGAYVLTDRAQAWAFYSLPTRAWQLGIGGLLAAGATLITRLPARPLTWAGWIGLAVIILAAVFIDPVTTPYPGVAALAPTLGTAAVIVAGASGGWLATFLANPGLRFLGKISFSLYLVHWPMLVLPEINQPIGQPLSTEVRVFLALAAIVAGWASYHWIEEPIHRGRRFAAPAGRTVVRGLAVIALTAVLALGVNFYETFALNAIAGVDGSPTPGVTARPTPFPSPSGLLTPSPTTTGNPGTSPSPTLSPTPAPPTPIVAEPLPPGLHPSLTEARDDWEQIEADGCTLKHIPVKPPDCVYGDPNSDITVALVGDSHAAHWFPALNAIAQNEGWKLVPFTKYSCRFLDLRMYSLILKREYFECYTWRTNVIKRLNELQPDLVVVSAACCMTPMVEGDDDPARQGEAMARFLVQIPGKIVLIPDTPLLERDVPACLAKHPDDIHACETPNDVAFGPGHLVLEQTAAADSGATVADMSGIICWRDPCPVVTGDILMWRDAQHLTATYATSLAPILFNLLPPLR